jgi:hypothetical protein
MALNELIGSMIESRHPKNKTVNTPQAVDRERIQ